MGAYVSTSQCQSRYNIIINCDFDFSNPNRSERFVGNYTYGNVPPDGDVAGIGIVSMFIGITSVALVMSAMDVIWRFAKAVKWKSRLSKEEKAKKLKRSCGGISFSELLESLVLSCSDQQVFTGGAYALTLRYWKGCSITAYHYSIVANMMLLTCATHLMSVAIVRNYWRYPWLALTRIAIVTGVFVFTGLLLSNMKATGKAVFHSKVPGLHEKNSGYLSLAACFQGGVGKFGETFADSLKNDEAAKQAFLFTTPGNRIEGWNFYLITLICYFGAIIVESVRFVQRSPRLRAYLRALVGPKRPELSRWGIKFARAIYGAWILGCVAISGVTIGVEAKYMMDLREWVRKSGWLEKDEWGNSAEDDATSFGQLVPVFLGLLTLFTFMQSISAEGETDIPRTQNREMFPSTDNTSRFSQGPFPMDDISQSQMSIGMTHSTDGHSQGPWRSQRSSLTPTRPTLHERDSRESGAALLGRPLDSPYSSTVAGTPVFPSTSRQSEMTSYSSYFPVEQLASPLASPSQPTSIPRRPVGASSPASTASHADFRFQSFSQ